MVRVVFTTSDIQETLLTAEDLRKRGLTAVEDGRYEEVDGKEYFVASTGRLEQALTDEYEVYLVTTRHVFFPFDLWWVEFVPRDHRFVPKAPVLDPDGRKDPDEERERLVLPWKRFLNHIGLPLPDIDEEEMNHRWFINDSEDYLKNNGIRLGRTLYPE